jgi:hypothetical protein
MKTINKQIITSSIITTIIASSIGYYLGTHRVSTQTNIRSGSMMGQGGAMRGGFARGGTSGGIINGDVVSFTDTILTVKSRDGGSRVILFTGTTKVSKSVEGTRADVKDGSKVLIIGSQNSDGSVTAETVQLRPDGTSTRP